MASFYISINDAPLTGCLLSHWFSVIKGTFMMKMATANLLRLPKGLNSNSHLEQYHTQSAGLVFCMNDNKLKGFW